jgi:hypothetical protein
MLEIRSPRSSIKPKGVDVLEAAISDRPIRKGF